MILWRCDHCGDVTEGNPFEPMDMPDGFITVETFSSYSHFCSMDHMLLGMVRIDAQGG